MATDIDIIRINDDDFYPLMNVPASVTGRYLAHNHLSPIKRSFLAGVDLYTGMVRPVDLTMVQCAALARTNPTAAWWAFRRQNERIAIESGEIPLVPARSRIIKANRHIPDDLDDTMLFEIGRRVGSERMLTAAAAVEAAE
jgi:hypothetical protein